MRVSLQQPWLEFDLGQVMQVLSWAPHGAGYTRARHILWRQVRNSDLPPDLDVTEWLTKELRARHALDTVCMLTSRDVTHHHIAQAQVEGVHVQAVATVGLSNAERVGHRVDRSDRDWNRDLAEALRAPGYGTINIALCIDMPLSQIGLLEALSIATEARTTAILEAEHWLPDSSGHATGTGTDCIAVAAPEGEVAYAGLHTALGHAVGEAVLQSVSDGARDWQASIGRLSGG
ncbi:adenosylcobinamide amidohydrolase [Roseinatronobacter bogoriensis]|uniref:Adenosylcobinamide amidohydrolase n=1 Tax=Roseinatronobacter bogoriensis subsp. barguzinensis TaxID=441209 RepID=A0A2K8K848_9RHOB|nr:MULTISPECIES: adenosylcobinamide amidohydrolase [Rhodobaca]ATX65619.1 adenosylcobinamide amidohydrolase [Rhodobaca barguzinensis]MBB4208444.1 adenosylcobinamide amidohydrolase [Rhodobaca bogoriensis DSM 18756]TDW39086.1 adenosylcobinamide amidohydrolase [Rhodobaca barguzinensis]TDY66405.1 adenosylcobinamide hydrolase [Rhodobaca bogoriensis DSM 18756]